MGNRINNANQQTGHKKTNSSSNNEQKLIEDCKKLDLSGGYQVSNHPHSFVINPYKVTHNTNILIFKYYIKYSDLVKSFKNFAVDGVYLTILQFNQCICDLLKFNIPIISYTYLSEKLFNLIDKVIIFYNFRMKQEEFMKKNLLKE